MDRTFSLARQDRPQPSRPRKAPALLAVVAIGALVLVPASPAAAEDPPTLESVTPSSVSSGGGTTITLTGTNLVGDADSEFVELNYGTHAKVPIACSPDGTTCTTMTPLVWWGSGDVELFVVAAGGTSNSLSLTFVPTPVVMEVNPSQGPLAGGTAITVLGANFVPGSTSITFGGAAATDVDCTTTQCTLTSPPASTPATVDLFVNTPQGSSNVLSFTYLPEPPTLTALSPSTGLTAGGTTVTLTGTNLSADAPNAVYFGPNVASDFECASTTSCTAVTPAGSAGTVDVYVLALHENSNTLPFTYRVGSTPPTPAAAPTLTSVTPDIVPSGGGTELTIVGTNLVGTVSLDFGGMQGIQASCSSDTTCTALSPLAFWGAGEVDLVAETSAGRSNALPIVFSPTPTIVTLENTRAPISGGTTVTAVGTNYLPGATTVTFGSENATNVNCTTTQCTFTSPPAAAPGTVDVVVHTAQGASNAMPFRYEPLPPTLTSMNPSGGPAAGGTIVTLTGTNLSASDFNRVLFGNSAGTDFQCASTTTCTVVTPPGPAGTTVNAYIEAEGSNSNTMPFTYMGAAAAYDPQAGPDTQQPAGTLPVTGGDDNGVGAALLGVLAVVGGALLMSYGRRRGQAGSTGRFS